MKSLVAQLNEHEGQDSLHLGMFQEIYCLQSKKQNKSKQSNESFSWAVLLWAGLWPRACHMSPCYSDDVGTTSVRWSDWWRVSGGVGTHNFVLPGPGTPRLPTMPFWYPLGNPLLLSLGLQTKIWALILLLGLRKRPDVCPGAWFWCGCPFKGTSGSLGKVKVVLPWIWKFSSAHMHSSSKFSVGTSPNLPGYFVILQG